MGGIAEKAIKDIKGILDVKRVEVVKDLSQDITFRDVKEQYFDDCGEVWKVPTTLNLLHTNFERVNITCIVYHDDNKCSLIEYRAFAIIKDDDIELIEGEVSYLLERMDNHVLYKSDKFGRLEESTRYLDVFVKDNTLFRIAYLNEEHCKEPLKTPFKGKVITDTLNGSETFYSFQGNTIYRQKIQTTQKDICGRMQECIDYFALKETVFYQDEKEIANVGFIDTSYYSYGDFIHPKTTLAVIVFTDGTKRVVIKKENGVKSISRYFDKLEKIKDLELSGLKAEGKVVFSCTVNGKQRRLVVGKKDGSILETDVPVAKRKGPKDLPF